MTEKTSDYRLRPHPEETREDIARFLDDEAASVKQDRPDLFVIINALAKEIRRMPVHQTPKGDGKELTICFVGPGGAGKTVAAHGFNKLFQRLGFHTTMRDEPCVLVVRDGSSLLGRHIGEAFDRTELIE